MILWLVVLSGFLDPTHVMTTPNQRRKRSYRQRVKCGECNKEIDSDYKEKHAKSHDGKLVDFTTVYHIDSAQTLLSRFFKSQPDVPSTELQSTTTAIPPEASPSLSHKVTARS